MKIAIAGATGLTGGLTLEKLLSNTQVTEIIAIGRNPTGKSHPKLKEVSLIEYKLKEEVKVDAFICCLGTTIKKAGSQPAFRSVDYELPLHLARELKAHGCMSVSVISAMGADKNSKIFYNRTKGNLEEDLGQMGFKTLAIFRPSLIVGPRKEHRSLEGFATLAMKFINPLLQASLKNYRSIEAKVIAETLVKTALQQKTGTHIYLSDEIKQFALD